MKKKHFCLVGLIIIVLVGAIGLFLKPEVVSKKNLKEVLEVVVDLTLPGVSYFENTSLVSIAFSEEPKFDPRDELNDILGGVYGQCQAYDLIENTFENGKWTYCFTLYGMAGEFLTQHNVPPIHQDNENINFCFYVKVKNIVIGGTSWWDYGLGCDSLEMTLILPENFDLRADVSDPLGWGKGGQKDNQYSIFTSAPKVEKWMEDRRWHIRASWVEGEFDEYNTDLYLEIHYRKS